MQLLKRAAALACSLALCASLMPAAVFADEGTEETTTPPATEQPAETEGETGDIETYSEDDLETFSRSWGGDKSIWDDIFGGHVDWLPDLQHPVKNQASKNGNLNVTYFSGITGDDSWFKTNLTVKMVDEEGHEIDTMGPVLANRAGHFLKIKLLNDEYEVDSIRSDEGVNDVYHIAQNGEIWVLWGSMDKENSEIIIRVKGCKCTPKAPTTADIQAALDAMDVKVACSRPEMQHGEGVYKLDAATVTNRTEPVSSDDGLSYTMDVMVDGTAYLAQYNNDTTLTLGHTHAMGAATAINVTVTFTYDAENKCWTNNAATVGPVFYVDCYATVPGEENKPSTDQILEALNKLQVKVTCKTEDWHSDSYPITLEAINYRYELIEDIPYQHYTLQIMVPTEYYVNSYNNEHEEEQGVHTLEPNYMAQAVEIGFTRGSKGTWVCDKLPEVILTVACDNGSEQPGTDAPKLPDYDYIKENIHGAVIVKCVNENAAHDTKIYYAEVMGPEGGDSYKVVRDSEDVNKATIQLNVRDIGLYTGVMDERTGIDHTYVAEGSTLEVKLSYDKVWKLEERAVVNVKCTTTGGNTGDSGNTGSSCDHDYVWQHSPDEHWQYCNKCGQVISNGAHNFQWKDGYQECTVCGYRVTTTSTAASANNSANNGTAATAAGSTSTAAAATSVNGIPQTSDEMPLGLLAGSTVIAAAAFVALTLLRKRRQQ